MPKITRVSLRGQAKIMRQTGERIILLINPSSSSSTSTPLDPTIANEAVNVNDAIKVPIYAKVTYRKFADIAYQEGGKGIMRKADIETTSEWQKKLQQCYGIQLLDGSILLKESENWSESEAIYYITVSGYIHVDQGI